MSESFPAWIALIGVFAVGLGATRGAMLRSRSFVARGRKYETPQLPPSPAAAATVRARVPRRRPKLGSAGSPVQPGLAR